jgi:hypothetical protein
MRHGRAPRRFGDCALAVVGFSDDLDVPPGKAKHCSLLVVCSRSAAAAL